MPTYPSFTVSVTTPNGSSYTRTVYYHIPEGATDAVILCHGGGSAADPQTFLHEHVEANTGCALFSAEALALSWGGSTERRWIIPGDEIHSNYPAGTPPTVDIAFMDALADYLRSNYSFGDIGIAGHSNGGKLVWGVAQWRAHQSFGDLDEIGFLASLSKGEPLSMPWSWGGAAAPFVLWMGTNDGNFNGETWSKSFADSEADLKAALGGGTLQTVNEPKCCGKKVKRNQYGSTPLKTLRWIGGPHALPSCNGCDAIDRVLASWISMGFGT